MEADTLALAAADGAAAGGLWQPAIRTSKRTARHVMDLMASRRRHSSAGRPPRPVLAGWSPGVVVQGAEIDLVVPAVRGRAGRRAGVRVTLRAVHLEQVARRIPEVHERFYAVTRPDGM